MPDLTEFRNPSEYNKVLTDMFLVYIRGPHFNCLSSEEREHMVDCYEEMMIIFSDDTQGVDIVEKYC